MLLRCSVVDPMFNESENKLRSYMFAQKVSNIKNAFIASDHLDYIIVKGDNDLKAKVQQIIADDFMDIGTVKEE